MVGCQRGVDPRVDGEWPDGLFGHWVMPVPDISGDGLADLIIAAPHAPVDGHMRGLLVARSPKTGKELWRRAETESENLGWDMALAGDQDGDGYVDLFVGAPAGDSGRVYLLSGKNGSVLRTYSPREAAGPSDGTSPGSTISTGTAPRSRRRAPFAADADGAKVGGAWVLSAASGRELYHWRGTDRRGGFGGVWRRPGISTATARARSWWQRPERKTRRGRSRGAAHLLRCNREGATALVGEPAG